MGAWPGDRFSSGQSIDADVEETANQRAEDPDQKIERPFLHNRLRTRRQLGTSGDALRMPNEKD